MPILKMKCNHIANPLGFDMQTAVLSWVTEGEPGMRQTKAAVRIALDPDMRQVVYDSGEREDIDGIAHPVRLEWKPRTRYYWRVRVWTDAGAVADSEIAWFETGKRDEAWQARWIGSPEDIEHPSFAKAFELPAAPISARLYACGVGLYEAQLNGEHVGGEYLTPGCNDYDTWLQVQTYDVTGLLRAGRNELSAILGPGWALGRFGLHGGKVRMYGERPAFLAELVVRMADGTELRIGTDASWQTVASAITASGIYDGETLDARLQAPQEQRAALETEQPVKGRLTDRRSLPVVRKETRRVSDIVTTPQGDTVLDFGQNMAGWVTFRANAPAGTEIVLEFSEFMQHGEFYTDNLLTAKQTFTYISDGTTAWVRPHFTYFGFRYARVRGLEYIEPESLEAWVLYSDMESTGELETSNPLVNRLVQNALWGQKSNFLEVPTDCPQRDERLGWTGDAQVFAPTAGFYMDTAAFFSKYLFDLACEQTKLNGAVPTVIPLMIGGGMYSAAWGDAATIIPWQQYVQFGDASILEAQWDSMKSWVEYVRSRAGETHLWKNDPHFGDWLALDSTTGSLSGGTLQDLIATAYYANSVRLLAKAAEVLGRKEDEREYTNLFEQIREAFLKEFVTPNGRIVSVTQTAQILPLYMELLPEEWRQGAADTLAQLVVKAGYRLQTGFVGTPFLCKMLSDYGHRDLAYKLLLNEELPGWLYPVKMGATTVWERWDSVLPDGSMAPHGMNSLNHYAYGSIVTWMVQDMAGIQPMENAPGYRRFRLAPKPNGRLRHAKARYDSRAGTIESGWSLEDDGTLRLEFVVPFHTEAELILPDCEPGRIRYEGARKPSDIVQDGADCRMKLAAGTHRFSYAPTVAYLPRYNSYSDLRDLLADERIAAIVRKHIPDIDRKQGAVFGMKLASMREMQFVTRITNEQLDAMDQELDYYYKSTVGV
ncbi:alpha-L-rhamnosidase [Paenibacillus sp.]|uniref:alpha-L-rhamnosidase n=1 Tax=Paenibacillus sp. TaxID=58172 RepID=UPI002D3ADBD3|nr:family 78 glycoside hydrolase catalytic domain [Paenibacillus sp.]HZG86268.1 family 78 glycoside hydrolase catalytic domain [Paenibacillus sp.]